MARQLADWSSFFLLPEGVSRELRGQGLVTWAHDNVWQQLRDTRPPQGTIRVRTWTCVTLCMEAAVCCMHDQSMWQLALTESAFQQERLWVQAALWV